LSSNFLLRKVIFRKTTAPPPLGEEHYIFISNKPPAVFTAVGLLLKLTKTSPDNAAHGVTKRVKTGQGLTNLAV
jgi:hypothetical protein